MDVREVEVINERVTEKTTFEYFEIKYDALVQEIGDRMVQEIRYLKDIRDAVKELAKKMDSVNEKLSKKRNEKNKKERKGAPEDIQKDPPLLL